MKVENNIQLNSQKRNLKTNSKEPNFTGMLQTALTFLDTNQAWGANAVDFTCMVVPRTWTDFGRGSSAGWETARRESMGTINDSSVGAYGTAAGLALAMGINKAYGLGKDGEIKASSIFADSETVDMMGKHWDDSLKAANGDIDKALDEFITKSLNQYEGISPNEEGKWVRFSEESINKAKELIKANIKKAGASIDKNNTYNAKNILVSSAGVENNYRIISDVAGVEHTSRYALGDILENITKLGKVFSKDKVVEAFKNSEKIDSNTFLKALKSMNIKRSLAGVGIATAVGCSVQPINMYLTKKKTGSDNFVGGGKKDTSTKFKIEKALVAAGFGAFVLSSIDSLKEIVKPKNLIKNLQFKGFTPTIKQLKFIYGATIISRFLAARNENELKESSIKDFLGFANWLILGNFVQKLVAQSIDKSLIKQEKSGGILNWIRTSSLKTRDEVLHAALGNDAFENGKALSFNQMLKKAKGTKAARQVKILTLAQVAGYVYSGLVLGIGIPKLNIYLTKRRMEKEAAKNPAPANTNEELTQGKQNKELPFQKRVSVNEYLNN